MELGSWVLANKLKKQLLKNSSPYTFNWRILRCAQDLIPSGKPTMTQNPAIPWSPQMTPSGAPNAEC